MTEKLPWLARHYLRHMSPVKEEGGNTSLFDI